MNRIETIFGSLRGAGKRALMPFVCGGYPSRGVTAEVLPVLERAGASVIEVGIPFSDPIADGPVIASAMHKALAAGATPESVFAEVAEARAGVRAGLVAMVSISIAHRLGGPGRTGAVRFVEMARRSGFDGLIVPDAPPEESEELQAAARDAGLMFTHLIAPTTPDERAARIARACTGFVYLLARAGITGETGAAPDVARRVRELRRHTDLPIACGFGISTPEHVRTVTAEADAAIVGSALVRRMGEGNADAVGAAGAFVRELAAGLG